MVSIKESFGSNQLWRICFSRASLAVAGFLVIALLYHSCSACSSKFVWISLSLGFQNSEALQPDASVERNSAIDSILPSPLPQRDAPENSQGALSALADFSSLRNRPEDQIRIAQKPAPSHQQADGLLADELLGKQHNSQTKIDRENHGNSSDYGFSSSRVENYNPEPDQTALESAVGIGDRSGADDVENGLGSPRLAVVKLPSSSQQNQTLRERPAQADHGNVSRTLEIAEFSRSCDCSNQQDCQRLVSGHNISAGCAQKPNWLHKSEEDLYIGKQAISTAAGIPLAAGGDLHAAVYLNVSTFKKSYELMEQIFRIFVYKEGAQPLVHSGPTEGIYASEGRFIRQLQQSRQFVVKDPKKAHLFFLPYSVANMVKNLYVPDSHSMLPLTDFITNYVNLIASKYPYWNRTQGADHFFVSCHDWGPATARGHAQLRRNSIKVVCNADLTEEFVLQRDISLPEIYLHSRKPPTSRRLGGPKPGRKRPYLAFFAGHMHGRVRPILLQHWKDRDPSMKIFEMLPATVAKKTSYVRHMKMSKFCICAMGFEVNSPRIVEAIYYDCVPVIIADNFVLPFSDVLDWTSFSVVLKEEEVPLLKQILISIPEDRYLAMQSRLTHVRQHFMWHPYLPSPKYDAFHMIIHSLWLTRLALLDHT